MKDVILTGLRSNNDLHIGNFFGAVLPTVTMAKTHDFNINMFLPDLHSFTTPIDHSRLYDSVISTARTYIAAGLPVEQDNVFVYRQSFVPAHSELTWILSCFTGFGQMTRMTQFKDKSKKFLDTPISEDDLRSDERVWETVNTNVSVGLFNYPILMAADILLYGAKYVPVGDDQTQHLEFARDIAQRMNSKFGELFTVPEPVKKQHEFFGKDQGLRIKDLQDPTKKMSKSSDSDKGVIFLTDEPSAAAQKIMAAATDSVGEIHFDWDNQPGITNLLQIMSLLTERDQAHVNAEWEGQTSYGEFKQAVARKVEDFLADFQVSLVNIDNQTVLQKLEQSEATMREAADETLLRIQQAVGLRA